MEDFQQRRGEDCKMEKMLRGQTMIMKGTIEELMNRMNGNAVVNRGGQAVIKKSKSPPI